MPRRPVPRRNRASSPLGRNAHLSSQSTLQALARGLSHEILNPLAGIKAALEVLRETERLSQHGHEIGAEINCEIEQIDRVVRQFLEFAFCPVTQAENLPVDALVESARDHLGVSSADFEIKLSAPKGLHVRADFAVLQKVLSELIQNSINHGAALAAITARPVGEQVVMTICNSGSPIDADIAARIFEPFFSTKPRRAGLGLPIAQRWLAAMKGTIKLLPARNGFEIRLPKGK